MIIVHLGDCGSRSAFQRATELEANNVGRSLESGVGDVAWAELFDLALELATLATVLQFFSRWSVLGKN